jgi:hypothetical protein
MVLMIFWLGSCTTTKQIDLIVKTSELEVKEKSSTLYAEYQR